MGHDREQIPISCTHNLDLLEQVLGVAKSPNQNQGLHQRLVKQATFIGGTCLDFRSFSPFDFLELLFNQSDDLVDHRVEAMFHILTARLSAGPKVKDWMTAHLVKVISPSSGSYWTQLGCASSIPFSLSRSVMSRVSFMDPKSRLWFSNSFMNLLPGQRLSGSTVFHGFPYRLPISLYRLRSTMVEPHLPPVRHEQNDVLGAFKLTEALT